MRLVKKTDPTKIKHEEVETLQKKLAEEKQQRELAETKIKELEKKLATVSHKPKAK